MTCESAEISSSLSGDGMASPPYTGSYHATVLTPSPAGRGRGVRGPAGPGEKPLTLTLSRRERGKHGLVWYPGEGVHLTKFPGKLTPGIARIGAAEDLAVDAAGQQKIGVGSVAGKVPDRAVGG